MVDDLYYWLTSSLISWPSSSSDDCSASCSFGWCSDGRSGCSCYCCCPTGCCSVSGIGCPCSLQNLKIISNHIDSIPDAVNLTPHVFSIWIQSLLAKNKLWLEYNSYKPVVEIDSKKSNTHYTHNNINYYVLKWYRGKIPNFDNFLYFFCVFKFCNFFCIYFFGILLSNH